MLLASCEITFNLPVQKFGYRSVRASLSLMVKRILRKYKYPPVKTEEVVELVLSQAEKLCEEWV